MNNRKGILGLGLIALGSFIGVYITLTTTGSILLGVIIGGLLGGLGYYLIDWAVSRRRSGFRPYDSMDEQHRVNNNVNTQSPGASFRTTQDDYMHIPPRK